MTVAKRCEVCGGTVSPVDDQSPFGYCEACGIVYALKERLQGRQSYEPPRVVESQSDENPRETDSPSWEAFAGTDAPTKQSGSHWKCPDCGADLRAENDSDLEFVKREHIREYHPNRSN
ncbi:MAG TPA: hypothetical protein VGR53_11205 [Nitrososphaerales archaeon]|nr:hypothetical protein [Nitrososphaerales archaeon]